MCDTIASVQGSDKLGTIKVVSSLLVDASKAVSTVSVASAYQRTQTKDNTEVYWKKTAQGVPLLPSGFTDIRKRNTRTNGARESFFSQWRGRFIYSGLVSLNRELTRREDTTLIVPCLSLPCTEAIVSHVSVLFDKTKL